MARIRLLLLRCVALVAVVVAGAGCGAGLITGAAASSGGGSGSGASAPSLSLEPVFPLVPADGDERSVLVTNASIVAGAPLRVQIAAAGVVVDQFEPVASGQGGSTLVAFVLTTAPILAALADPTAADVAAELRVLVDGREVAPPAPLTLARQPEVVVELPPGMNQLFMSPGGERVRFRVAGLRADVASEVQVFVVTPDPSAPGVGGEPAIVVRPCADVRLEPPTGADTEVSALAPANVFATRATFFLIDAIAGRSTDVSNTFYRPDIAVALPGQGSNSGGSVVTLIGTALAPYDFTTGTTPAPLDFDAVQLSFQKGGRVSTLPREDLRIAESSTSRLVFTIPPSPDGRPGQVDIVLRVELDGAIAEFVASQVFLFANPRPFFGPRGCVLDRLPVAVAPIALDQAPSLDGAPDFAALTDQGGVAFVQLLLAQQNGMFQPFAAPQRVGDPEAVAEREPRDLCIGDFDGDGVPDLFVVNAGTEQSTHQVVLGQLAPLPPLGAVRRWSTPGGMARGRTARFDADMVPDIVLVPGVGAPAGQRPIVLLARPTGPGSVAFLPPVELAVRLFPYEVVEVADFDGDGALDVAVASGAQGKLDVAFGNGVGSFTEVAELDFVVPGYVFDNDSPAVGLHACGDGPLQSIAIVFAGVLSSFGGGLTQPCVARMRQTSVREFAPPLAPDTLFLPTEPIGRSLAADLDQAPPIELVVAMRGEPQLVSLGLLQLGPNGFAPLSGAIEGGAESPRQIRAVVFDRAFPATATAGEKKAVFLVHEAEVDGVREKRLSTRLVVSSQPGQPRLLPPDAGGQVAFGIERIVAGDFHPTSVALEGARDVALARTTATGPSDAIVLVANDGFGGLPALGNRCDFPGLLPASATALPAPAGQIDLLAFLSRDSRLAVWRHDPAGLPVQEPDGFTAPLRQLLADPVLAATDLGAGVRLIRGDVDGDGVDDLVALLVFASAQLSEGQGALALLRGKAAPAVGEFPFHAPSGLTLTHGRAADVAIGDFVRNGTNAPLRLEAAVAVPVGVGTDGNHVRFYRYVPGATPADDRLVPGAAAGGPQVLLAGSNPTRLVANDFDRDGSVDLLVAGAGDSALRLYRNTASVAPSATGVSIGAFVEAFASPWAIGPGAPTALPLADVNGDGNLDALAFCEAMTGTVRSTTVGLYLGGGDGSFVGPRFLSPTRLGTRDGSLAADLGDWNRDGLPDLLLGWDTTAVGDINLRVLFGGTR